jgi:MFS family permease
LKTENSQAITNNSHEGSISLRSIIGVGAGVFSPIWVGLLWEVIAKTQIGGSAIAFLGSVIFAFVAIVGGSIYLSPTLRKEKLAWGFIAFLLWLICGIGCVYMLVSMGYMEQ